MSAAGEGDTSVASGRPWPRWMRVVLVASLAFNLFVVGALATAAWRHRHGGYQAAWQANVFGFARSLPETRRQEIMDSTRDERGVLRPFRAELRKKRQELHEAIVARPFDAAAYKRANDELLAAEFRAREAAHKFYDAIVVKLTDDERRALVRWLARADRPWRGRRRGPDGQADGAGPQTGPASQSGDGVARRP